MEDQILVGEINTLQKPGGLFKEILNFYLTCISVNTQNYFDDLQRIVSSVSNTNVKRDIEENENNKKEELSCESNQKCSVGIQL